MDTPARFFPGDFPAVRDLLAAWLDAFGADAARQPWADDMVALVLSGGYGRGEGGILIGPDGTPGLYNDLEFYLFTRGEPSQATRSWVKHHEQEGTAALGIDVEIHAMPWERFLSGRPSMFYYDLLAAHYLVAGDPQWTRSVPPEFSDAAAIPAEEGTRLLFNRGSSLYFAGHAIARDTPRRRDGYVPRIHGKILLALGDAVLVAHGCYHWSCRQRNAHLAGIPAGDAPACWETVVDWHAQGVDFKFHPGPETRDDAEVARRQEEIRRVWSEVFLWCENRRLGTRLTTLQEYASWQGHLLTNPSALKSAALRARDRWKLGRSLGRWTEPPRATLLRCLARLHDPGCSDLASVARDLGLPAGADRDAVHDAYRQWWTRYP